MVTALAYVFHKNNFKFKNIIETLIVLPMSLPPTVIGYILLILIGRRGLIGKYFYEWFGWNIVFSWKAACLVAVVVTVPLMYQNAKIGFDNVQKEIKEAAKVDGAESFQIFRYIIFPMASKGILAGILLSCIRAMGEFGATLIVAGNIPGQTQTIPLLIYFSIENGEIKLNDTMKFSAQCIRVPVLDGHLACVSFNLENNPGKEALIEKIKSFKSDITDLPLAPKEFIHYYEENDRPQPLLDRDNEKGMQITVGRLREDNLFDYKFVGLSHNTLRGAAGGAVLTAELIKKLGYLD